MSGSSIPDDAWEQFQRESEGPARLRAPKEPSARARIVAERLRRADEEAARQGLGKRRRAEPDAWRAWASRDRVHKPRSRAWGLVWVVVAVGVALVVMNPGRALSWFS
ncbi:MULTISPECIES: hypothetical protein [unclassified Streptomyces]|uniref:hypothetical protein n=1 Tax=unclassified Streptomyces TaxID=2593676 RepID=UPI0028C43CB0|nr:MULTISPECIES: hypothetical protein [unclassified Streptomyces]WNO71619.1 hypothetical protein RPQ07_08230 [Streptomyces sp. AM8-1-1]